MADLERAVGQYVMYKKALSKQAEESDRILYLAMPTEIYKELTNDRVVPILSDEMNVRLLVYNPIDQTLLRWIG